MLVLLLLFIDSCGKENLKHSINNQPRLKCVNRFSVSVLFYGCTIWSLTKPLKKKNWWKLRKNTKCRFKPVREAAPDKTSVLRPLTSYLTNDTSRMSTICRNTLMMLKMLYSSVSPVTVLPILAVLVFLRILCLSFLFLATLFSSK